MTLNHNYDCSNEAVTGIAGNWLINEHGREYQVDGHEIYQFDAMPEYRELWHGIPLTPEVLEACDWNGYKSLYIGSYFNLDTYGHLYYGSDYTGINVDYLHQLQNLYFDLCGQELEYKPKV